MIWSQFPPSDHLKSSDCHEKFAPFHECWRLRYCFRCCRHGGCRRRLAPVQALNDALIATMKAGSAGHGVSSARRRLGAGGGVQLQSGRGLKRTRSVSSGRPFRRLSNRPAARGVRQIHRRQLCQPSSPNIAARRSSCCRRKRRSAPTRSSRRRSSRRTAPPDAARLCRRRRSGRLADHRRAAQRHDQPGGHPFLRFQLAGDLGRCHAADRRSGAKDRHAPRAARHGRALEPRAACGARGCPLRRRC